MTVDFSEIRGVPKQRRHTCLFLSMLTPAWLCGPHCKYRMVYNSWCQLRTHVACWKLAASALTPLELPIVLQRVQGGRHLPLDPVIGGILPHQQLLGSIWMQHSHRLQRTLPHDEVPKLHCQTAPGRQVKLARCFHVCILGSHASPQICGQSPHCMCPGQHHDTILRCASCMVLHDGARVKRVMAEILAAMSCTTSAGVQELTTDQMKATCALRVKLCQVRDGAHACVHISLLVDSAGELQNVQRLPLMPWLLRNLACNMMHPDL